MSPARLIDLEKEQFNFKDLYTGWIELLKHFAIFEFCINVEMNILTQCPRIICSISKVIYGNICVAELNIALYRQNDR